jgi:hypothetical protein
MLVNSGSHRRLLGHAPLVQRREPVGAQALLRQRRQFGRQLFGPLAGRAGRHHRLARPMSSASAAPTARR